MSKPVPTKIALKISENHITFSSLAGIYGLKIEDLRLPKLKAMTDVCRDRSRLQNLRFHLTTFGSKTQHSIAIQP